MLKTRRWDFIFNLFKRNNIKLSYQTDLGLNPAPSNQSSFGLVDDTSIFIGLTSMPMGKEIIFNKEILAHIKEHKNRTKDYIVSDKTDDVFTNFLYEPRTFFVFGTFDLATLALIDDFEFCTQAFHPFDPIYPTDQELNINCGNTNDPDGESGRRYFAHHLIVGPAPCWAEDKGQITKLASDTFLLGPSINHRTRNMGHYLPLPLFGICQLKINNGLLIGSGTEILRCAIRAIKKIFDTKYKINNGQSPDFQIIILESWSWHELTLLLFSNSYSRIIDFIVELGELTVFQIKNILGDDDPALISFLNSNCLINKIIEHYAPLNPDNKPDFFCSHLFWNSTTTLGFRFEIFDKGGVENTSVILQSIDPNDYILPFSRWHSRGGHAITGSCILTGKEPSLSVNDVRICVGRGDIVWPYNDRINLKDSMKTTDFINDVVKSRTKNMLGNHFLSTNTIISIGPKILKDEKGNLKYNIIDQDHHYPFLSNLVKKRLTISITDIRRDLYSSIRHNLIPKVVAERLFNSISLFNEGFDDPFLLSSFIEFYPYMNTLINEVKNINNKFGADSSIGRSADYINQMIDIFNQAWRNRYYVSYRLGDISDFNLEYKGGIQQLVSAFDGAYKILAQSLIGHHDVLAIVGGNQRISSTRWTVRLNYFDIFMPEFFVARATHEAAEAFLYSYEKKRNYHKYHELFYLIDPENKDRVKELLEKNDINSASKIYEMLCGQEDLSSFLSNVYADTCAKRITYGKDLDLFLYWYRNIALTDSIFWTIPGESEHIHKKVPADKSFFRFEVLYRFLTRIFIQIRFIRLFNGSMMFYNDFEENRSHARYRALSLSFGS